MAFPIKSITSIIVVTKCTIWPVKSVILVICKQFFFFFLLGFFFFLVPFALQLKIYSFAIFDCHGIFCMWRLAVYISLKREDA